MKRLVIQVNIKGIENKRVDGFKYLQDLYEISNHQAKKYAEKHGAEYLLITDTSFLPNHSAPYQRLKIFELTDYDQILYLDSDAVIMDDCPNMFELFKDFKFSACRDFPYDLKKPNHEKERQKMNSLYGASENYRPFCSGVLLISKSFIKKSGDTWKQYLHYGTKHKHDQGILNQLVVNFGESYNELDENWGVWYASGKYIDHLGGNLRKLNFNKEKYVKKMNLIDFLPSVSII